MESLTISRELGQEILTYLGSRPYAEVFTLINRLQTEAATPSAPPAPVIEHPAEEPVAPAAE